MLCLIFIFSLTSANVSIPNTIYPLSNNIRQKQLFLGVYSFAKKIYIHWSAVARKLMVHETHRLLILIHKTTAITLIFPQPTKFYSLQIAICRSTAILWSFLTAIPFLGITGGHMSQYILNNHYTSRIHAPH